jgi:hypothetical protein
MDFIQKANTTKRIHKILMPLLRTLLCVTLLVAAMPQRVHAQYAVIPVSQHNQQWSTSGLFACTIVNSTTKTPSVYLNCLVMLNKNVVFRAKSNVFLLNSGSNFIGNVDVENKISPIQTLYVEPQMRAILEKTAIPADGDYEIKLDLVERTENAVLAYAQYPKKVTNNFPFHLITPFDGSKVDNLNPVFTWIRPLSMGSQNGEQAYNIRVAEIYSGQSPYEAIRANASVIRQSGLPFNLYQSSTTNEYLADCKKYAWQVEATTNSLGKTAATQVSEVWSFSTPCNVQTVKNHPHVYYQMQSELNSTSYPAYDTLRIALEYLYADVGQIKGKIVGLDSKSREVSFANDQATQKKSIIYVGDNRFAIPLTDKGLKKDNQYTLEIGDGALKYYISFLYLNN